MSRSGTKPCRWWKALILGMILPGLGQVYTGRSPLGFGVCAAQILPGMIGYSLMGTFAGLITAVSMMLVYHAVFAAEAAFRIVRNGPLIPHPRRGWVYPAFIVLSIGLTYAMSALPQQYEAFVVPTPSMTPALRPGDRFMAERIDPEDPLHRGEVAVFLRPDGVYFVKRVAAVAGDRVRVEQGMVYVNDVPVNSGREPKGAKMLHGPSQQGLVLEKGQVFMLGDNAARSWDSRYFGPVDREDVRYRALYLYWAQDGRTGRKLGQFQ